MKIKNINTNRYNFIHQYLKNHIEKSDKKPVLYDIGAIDGRIQKYVNKLNLKYYGFDLVPKDNQVIQWNILEPLANKNVENADIILLLDVIEHVKNPWLGIKNIYDVLNKDGILILTTPNPKNSINRIRFLFTGYINGFRINDLIHNHHVFIPYPHIIKKILKDNDLQVEEYYTLSRGLPKEETNRSFKTMLLRFIFYPITKLIEIVDHSAHGISYCMIAKKK